MEAAGGVPLFQQQACDQQPAQPKKNVDPERTIAGDIAGVAVLSRIEALDYMVRQYQHDRHRAPPIQ